MVHLVLQIEVFDKRGGVSQSGVNEVCKMTKDTRCSRVFVRFVHERNACNCLGSAYNELKRTTKRTNVCSYCKESKPKQIKECSGCKMEIILLSEMPSC